MQARRERGLVLNAERHPGRRPSAAGPSSLLMTNCGTMPPRSRPSTKGILGTGVLGHVELEISAVQLPAAVLAVHRRARRGHPRSPTRTRRVKERGLVFSGDLRGSLAAI